MKYVLDTDIISYFFKGRHPKLAERIFNLSIENIFTTVINHAELWFGIFNAEERKQQHLERVDALFKYVTILPFCENASKIFAEQKAFLKKQGRLIEDLDLMIASIALQHKYTLVTNNTKHFSRIKHLKIENWTE